tara:strand:- start:1306 stop:1419 length:114 start_codon:yes stop_codon:yes gene_type:complete
MAKIKITGGERPLRRVKWAKEIKKGTRADRKKGRPPD